MYYVPLATAATYVFVAFFVLVIVFVAVPAREEVMRAGERGYTEGDVPSAPAMGWVCLETPWETGEQGGLTP